MTVNRYIAGRRTASLHDAIWIRREHRRYEEAGRRFRELGAHGYADLYDGFAEQALMEISALEKMEERMAALDDEITASAIAFGGPLPTVRETAE